MLEVRTKAYQNSLDWAVLLRVCDAGTWGNYRVFHSGMVSGVPVANGGTGATTAANARSNLGTNNAGNITTGTLAMARLPFKVAYGSGSVAGNSALSINYSGAGFTAILDPLILPDVHPGEGGHLLLGKALLQPGLSEHLRLHCHFTVHFCYLLTQGQCGTTP